MPTGSSRLPTDERRAATVEAVLALAAQQDPSAITTTAIAERMKLTQGALFKHFPTKDAIWEAVIGWASERLLGRIDDAARAAASPLAAVEGVFFAHIDFVARHPGVPRVMFGELQRKERTPAKRMARQLMLGYRERVQSLVERGQAQGEIAREIDAATAATLLIGMVQGLVMQAMLNGDLTCVRTQAPNAFAIYRRGLEGRNSNAGVQPAPPQAADRSHR
ncbi:MAG TPA: TetR/AcrR family transcriptional regulator [Burkholderiaceae bacterium]|nr:TetR/AcrR family transcriptional regulator [Burkholderiaceae bacterium]